MPKFMFSGIARIKVIEAENLKATDYSTRIFQNSGFLLSPYVNIDIDDLPLGRTVTKHRNQNPTFNEEFKADIHLGNMLNCTVFHDSALPPDEFVANCSLPLHSISDELKAMSSDLWVDLEPNGRLHLNIELDGEFTESKPFKTFYLEFVF
jgi:novel protein kinase C epsilon type